jgi:hypothetical protein
MATSSQKVLSALDRRFAGPYTFIVPNGTRNSSEEITMSRTIKFTKAGGPEVLEFIETEVKAPGPREVRIKVKAIGINRAESMWRHDEYVESPTRIARKQPWRLYHTEGLSMSRMVETET